MKTTKTKIVGIVAIFGATMAVATTYSTPPAQIPQTGQTTSYATSDNGALQTGTVGTNISVRFVTAKDPNGNACINGQEVESDMQTGLMWVKAPSSTTYTWAKAVKTSATSGGALPISYCGYTDWRLPNLNELRSLVNYGESNVATWLNSTGFSNVQADDYWSSTIYAFSIGNAWSVNMSYGRNSVGSKTSYLRMVWPVRGGQ